jgi:hypothetical protein
MTVILAYAVKVVSLCKVIHQNDQNETIYRDTVFSIKKASQRHSVLNYSVHVETPAIDYVRASSTVKYQPDESVVLIFKLQLFLSVVLKFQLKAHHNF